MQRILRTLRWFLMDQDGPTAVEYAVMLALIASVCLAAISALGQSANNSFSKVGAAMQSSAGSPDIPTAP